MLNVIDRGEEMKDDVIDALIEAIWFAYRSVDWYGKDPDIGKWVDIVKRETGLSWKELRKRFYREAERTEG